MPDPVRGTESMDQPDSPTIASLPPERPRGASDSRLRQFWLNLRVWVPFLLNPTDRDRQVVYWARDCRDGLLWKIALPKQCWGCGTNEGVKKREFRRSVRSFEYPLPILIGTLSFAALFLVLGLWLWTIVLLACALAMLALCGLLLLIKSWIEDVRVVMWSCPRHADDLPAPELVVDREQLYLYAPTAGLAKEANAEIKEERLKSNRARAAARGAEVADEPPARTEKRTKDNDRPGRTVPQPKADLPPLKLADDE